MGNKDAVLVRIRSRLALTFCWLLAFTIPAFAATTPPIEVISVAIDEVIRALSDRSLDFAGKRARTLKIVEQNFNFEAMTARTVATAWSSTDDAHRVRLVTLFKALLANTYWQKMAAYRGERIDILDTHMTSETLASVKSVVRQAQTEIPVEYKMMYDGKTWRAYDVVIEQVSLVRHYREEFLEIVHRAGVDGLITYLEQLVAKRE